MFLGANDRQAFGTHEQTTSTSLIWVRTRLGWNPLHICTRAPTTVQSAEKCRELSWRAAILLAAVTTVGAIYSSPINKAPTDSDTQADRGIIFI